VLVLTETWHTATDDNWLRLATSSDCAVVGGDFNIKTQSSDDPGARRLADLLTSFDMVQHVRGPTQRRGNTLDVVVTPANCALDSVDIEPFGMLSDHSLIVSRVPFVIDAASVVETREAGMWLATHRPQRAASGAGGQWAVSTAAAVVWRFGRK